MANIKKLDPGASPLHYFGAELRWWRERAGLTLEQVGTRVYLTGSQIGQFETAVKVPRDEHVPRLDQVVGAGGALIRAWELAKRQPLPPKLRQIAEIESSASQILAFEPQLVPGLVQTEQYARAVLGVVRRQNLDVRVAGRMARQRMLEWEEAPLLWVVLCEAALHQEVGGPEVMRTQLVRLLSYRHSERVHVQVLPFRAGAHAGVMGNFSLYLYEDRPTVAYVETYGRADASVDPLGVRDYSYRYDLLRAAALSIENSAELITRVMEERYGHRVETEPPNLA
ncbi:helix-turn-helix domain-containing protein [Streptomyces cacaoi]|uniref:Transcriptional regulator n=1 Tax=Streptomyces cacaoi TaxID=1898 RepID=A0A4Y3R9X7_STRCI|nr:helix-turn-helix transcriptional regulator [Streptomyces cacaoi]NNG85935.1 helix-turn-helix domain-containing protein [Streptomyces cacaoi]GEB53493.1 transcriptional regulator [Streptomyces cacaoi]